MSEVLLLPTEKEGLVLRQLATDADDITYFQAVDANRDHLSQFDDITALKYLDLESVKQARENPEDPDKLRMGIWDEETFVGSINLTPYEDGAEIGYWVDSRHTGHGYATLATKAMALFALQRYPKVYAKVADGNEKSMRVLERAGFHHVAMEVGRLVFELDSSQELGETKNMHSKAKLIPLDETKSFARPGFSGNEYVTKDDKAGFNALLIEVHGKHPKKLILPGNTRIYFVISGEGTFIIDGQTKKVQKHDLVELPAGSEYEYQGSMALFEFNVSPDNSFGDQKLE